MSSLTYTKLCRYGVHSIAKWLQKNPLFATSTDLLFVPINRKNSHWSLGMVDYRTCNIALYDPLSEKSIGFHNNMRLLMASLELAKPESNLTNIKRFENSNMGEPRRQLDARSCGVFVRMAANFLIEGLPENFIQEDIPLFRKYMAVQLANTGKYFKTPERHEKQKRSDHTYMLKMARPKDILSLPYEVLEMILKEVLKEGDKQYYILSLVCQRFRETVSKWSFRRDVHFTWLKSIYNWSKPTVSKEFKEENFKMYEIRCCFQCERMYKEMCGLIGNGKYGHLYKFYSNIDFPGFCSQDCAGRNSFK